MQTKILIGTNVASFKDKEKQARQEYAIGSINQLCAQGFPLKPVNVCFPDENLTPAGWTASPTLQQASHEILKTQAYRLPMTRELFDRCAETALQMDCPYFLFANSDIALTPLLFECVDIFLQRGIDTVMVSRTNIPDPAHPNHNAELYIIGQDVWLCSVAWWLKNRHRFQNYILGIRGWDIVYTSIMLCHSMGFLFNTRGGACYHVNHPHGGLDVAAYNDYNFKLEHGRDRIYSQRYNHYQYQVSMFIQLNHRMLTDAENHRFVSVIFSPPTPEEMNFSESLAHAFSEGRCESYMRVMNLEPL